jgi:thiamine transporter
MSHRFQLSVLVETAVMVALAVVLSQFTLFKLPQGGSVTPGSMVPILLVGLRHGVRWGTLAGVSMGILDLIIRGYVVHPVQLLLDYPVAFGLLGLAGLARNKPAYLAGPLSALALLGRFVAHWISGVVFFAEYAEGQNVWVYSAVYNGSYMLPELLISGAVLLLVYPALRRVLPGAGASPGTHA